MIRNILKFAIRKAASDPRVRAKATDTAKKIAKGAGEIARDPDPARKLGRLAGKIKNKLKI
tara:strand:+ start:1464 stop:1646 length:183 start_codon:yes stop_codon:yes gene_type:complete